VKPVYPPEAKKAGIQGIVVLRTTIEKDGRVSRLEVVSGQSILAQAALEAVQQWRYAPMEKALTTDVDVNFTLANAGAAAPAQPASTNITEEVPPPAETAPKLITKVKPVYPPEAKKAGIQGIVVLRTTIKKDGSVSRLEVVSGKPILAKAALEAVQQWRYAPMEKALTTDVDVNFTLAEGPGPGSQVGGVYRVGNGVSAPIPTYKPEPPYTPEAKAAKLQGTVTLWIVIGADGAVTEAKVIRELGKGLDESAVQTVKTWKFKPAMKDGKPVPCGVSVEIDFKFF
jgi:TonB family protein